METIDILNLGVLKIYKDNFCLKIPCNKQWDARFNFRYIYLPEIQADRFMEDIERAFIVYLSIKEQPKYQKLNDISYSSEINIIIGQGIYPMVREGNNTFLGCLINSKEQILQLQEAYKGAKFRIKEIQDKL